MSLVVNDAEKRITNPYGGGHNGVDIGWRSNEVENEVWANCAGEVVEVQDGLGNIPNATGVKSWGNYVYIKHPNGMYTRYAHLKSGIHVKVGEQVNALTSLGIIGESGNAIGRHLHFEVSERYDSRYRIDPTPYLTKPVYDSEVVEEPQPAPAPTSSDKFNIGDRVVINGPLYISSNAASPAGSVSNRITNITRKNPGSAHPYNTTGDLGWMDESSIRKADEPQPTPQPAPQPTGLQIGDRVRITGTGNGSSYGDSNTAYGIGWERQILNIWNGRPFPYQVGNNTGTTGFYKESSLQKL